MGFKQITDNEEIELLARANLLWFRIAGGNWVLDHRDYWDIPRNQSSYEYITFIKRCGFVFGIRTEGEE